MYRWLIILILIPFNIFAQNYDYERSFFEGIVCSSIDSTLLPDVHVINFASDKVTASLSNGLFRIPVKEGDKIYFSTIEYGLTPFIITDSILEAKLFTFYLNPKIYELDVTEVRPFLSYKEFKDAFLALELEDLIDLQLTVPIVIKQYTPGQIGVTINGPITALYMAFSKEGKSLRKYQETIQKADYQKYITSKYNPEFVKTITGFEDDEVLKAFMDFCDFTDQFIEVSSEYEIIAALKNCLQAYTKHN